MKFKNGNKPWNKGIKTNYYSSRMLGKKHTEEAREKIVIGNKGKVVSSEVRAKIGKANKGKSAGDKHPRWKGGVTPLYKRIRYSPEYKLWRKAVFQRDNYTCIWCGAKNGEGKDIILNAEDRKSTRLNS